MIVSSNIVICVGQAGLQIGAAFWTRLCREHRIDPETGRPFPGETPAGDWLAFFSRLGEGPDAAYIPRSVMVDLEPAVIGGIAKSGANLFDPASLIAAEESASGNFAVGYRSRGRDLLPSILDRVDREVEKCENVGSFMVVHSLGGGTGSGLGGALIEELKARFPDSPVLSSAILPSPNISSVVTEPYNTVLGLSILEHSADACLIFDNEALFQIARNRWHIESPAVTDLNHLITESLLGFTAPMRFSGFQTVEISARELLMNLVPRRGLHFLITAGSPLAPPEQSKFEQPAVEQMMRQVFSCDHTFAACSPMHGRYLAGAVLCRGMLRDRHRANKALADLRPEIPLTSWIPTAFKVGHVESPGLTHRKSIALVANNTRVVSLFERAGAQFDQLWQRRAFANWYLSEGMTEQDFEERRAAVDQLAARYQAVEQSGGGPGPGSFSSSSPASAAAAGTPLRDQSPPTPLEPLPEQLTIRESDEIAVPTVGTAIRTRSDLADIHEDVALSSTHPDLEPVAAPSPPPEAPAAPASDTVMLTGGPRVRIRDLLAADDSPA